MAIPAEPEAAEAAADFAPSRDFHLRWPTLKPPLRPSAAVAAQIAGLLSANAQGPDAPRQGRDQRIVLLGVTPELAMLDFDVIAIDWNPAMIAIAWPGDAPRRRAVLGDWRAMPLPDASVDGAMADGAITMLLWPEAARQVIGELWRVVRPGGRVVIRCFATPEEDTTVAEVCAAAMAGQLPFHAFKLAFNMACAREARWQGAAPNDPGDITVSSAALFARFAGCFPDRAALSQASGWPAETIAEMDAYENSAYVHCYPRRSELAVLIAANWPGPWQLAETSGYPLAERCPLLVLDRP